MDVFWSLVVSRVIFHQKRPQESPIGLIRDGDEITIDLVNRLDVNQPQEELYKRKEELGQPFKAKVKQVILQIHCSNQCKYGWYYASPRKSYLNLRSDKYVKTKESNKQTETYNSKWF